MERCEHECSSWCRLILRVGVQITFHHVITTVWFKYSTALLVNYVSSSFCLDFAHGLSCLLTSIYLSWITECASYWITLSPCNVALSYELLEAHNYHHNTLDLLDSVHYLWPLIGVSTCSGLREWFAQRDGSHVLPPAQRMAKLGSELLPGKLRKRHTPKKVASFSEMFSAGSRSAFEESEIEDEDFYDDSEVNLLPFGVTLFTYF